MRYSLRSRVGKVIPSDITLGVVMRKTVLALAVAAAVAPATALPPGTDRWYNVAGSAIPLAATDAQMCAATDITEFTVDDDSEFEGDIPGLPIPPVASAWWQITVPADSPSWLLTVDTWLTTGGTQAGFGSADYPGPLTYPTDTNITILSANIVNPMVLGTDVDFEDLTIEASSDDSPDAGDPAHPFLTKISDVALAPGKVYWIRVDTYDFVDPADPLIVRLRVTLTPP